MTPDTFLERLRDHLQAMVWPSTSSKIFNASVHVTTEFPAMQLARMVTPFCAIVDQGDVSAPEAPGLITQNFSLVIAVENVGEPYGDNAVLGGNRTDPLATSVGAGLKEIEKVVLNYLMQIIELPTPHVATSEKVVLVAKSRTKGTFLRDNIPNSMANIVFYAYPLSAY